MDEHEDELGKQEWNELDQTSVRKSIREIIQHDMPGDYGEQVTALRHLVDMVKEEAANALASDLNMFMRLSPQGSRKEAEALVAVVEHDLGNLGLALKDPESGRAVRLGIAATPPPSSEMSWIEARPITNATGQPAKRLPSALPTFELMVSPLMDQGRNRLSSR